MVTRKSPAQLQREVDAALADFGRRAEVHWGTRAVEVDTSAYRRTHGAEPRGRGDWTFVIGKKSYAFSDDPTLYRPARARGVPALPYSKARDYAIAEARRRGELVIGVGP